MRRATLALLLASAGAQADFLDGGDYIFVSTVEKRFKVTQTTPYKESYLLALRYTVVDRNLNHQVNRFCTIGYQMKGGDRFAPTYWDSEKVVYLWSPEGYDLFNNISTIPSSLIYSQKINYSWVVPKAEINIGIRAGMYAKEDFEPMREDCNRRGETIVIKPFTPPASCMHDETSLGTWECLTELAAMK